jgi:hypothetical protein
MNGMAIVCGTGTVINASPPSRSVNRLSYWSRRKREKKKLPKWTPRAARTRRALCRKLVRKADDRNFACRVYYKGERCGDSETVLCRKRITKKAAGLPSFDRKYQACVMGCRLFLLEFDPVPSHWIGFTVSGQLNPVLRIFGNASSLILTISGVRWLWWALE